LRHDSSRLLFNYWNTIRKGRRAPDRSEIEPSDVRQILGDTFILEVSMQLKTISYRLAGTRLCAAHGRELKGLGYLALWREEDNYEIARSVNLVYSEYKPVVLAYAAMSAGERFVEYECIMLPLLPAADGNARVLGAATPKRAPYWLGSDPLLTNHLRSMRVIEGKDLAPAPDKPAEIVPISAVNPKVPRRMGHLTVFDGGLNSEKRN
jgi:hypothetical protein